MIKQHKLPTLIGLLLLILGIGAGVFVIQQRSVPVTASPDQTPSDIRITNITDTSFTVSWVTSTPTVGFVAFGKSESLGSTTPTAADTKTSLHHITITTLGPDTTYYFKVASNENLFGNVDEPYEAKTVKSLSAPPAPDVISGTINISSGNPASGAIVYVSLPGVTPQSSVADSNGRWSLPLSTARNSTLSAYATYTPSTILEIFALMGKNRFASAKIQAGSAHPVPPIIIGKTHDFGNIQPVASSGVPMSQLDIPESEQSVQDQPSPSPTPQGSKVVTITYPENSEQVNTQSPAFSGTGTPNLTFTIKVESETPQTAAVTVDKKGKWTWTPPSNLPPGEHKLTISWKDDKGKTQATTHNFTILAQGKSNNPAFTASGSAQIASPSPSPRPSATPQASPSPKSSGSPTPKVTPSPTPRVSYPSTSSGIPTSGSLTGTIGIIIMGLILIALGLFLPRTRVFKYY